jgi:hypothetical protein
MGRAHAWHLPTVAGGQMGFSDPSRAVAVLTGAHNIGQSRATGRSQCSRGLVSHGVGTRIQVRV